VAEIGFLAHTLFASIPFPQIDPVAFALGPLKVHWYGLAYLTAFIGSILIARWLVRRWQLNLTDDDLLTILLAAVIGVMVGARLGYVLVYGGRYYLENPVQIVAVWDGGMSFHGGLAGILIAGAVVARTLGMPWLTLCDIGSVGAPIGFGLGRITNFINAELWGRTTDVAWAVVFPGAGAVARHPSQLYEATLEGAVLLSTMLLLARALPPRPRGELLGWLLTLYGTFRIVAELFREPDAQLGFLLGGVTMGQLLSAPMVLIGVSLIWWARKQQLPQLGRRGV
jgi:phosphatidylglycerol:prolipoprotein diacylglycerol transferase